MKKFFIIILLMLFSVSSYAGNTASSLDLSANSYEESLSYGGVAIGDDIGGISYNPAVAANIDTISGSLNYLSYVADIGMIYGNIVYPSKKFNYTGRFGYLHMPSITDYNTGDELKYYEFFFGPGVGYKYNDNLSLGANLNFYTTKIADIGGVTGFLNIGANYKTSLPLIHKQFINIGLSILNLGPGIKFNEQRSALPLNFNLGLKYTYEDNYRLYLGIKKMNDIDNLLWAVGGEIVMFKFFSARVSSYSDLNNELNFNMGLGFKLNISGYNFILDYTSLPMASTEYTSLLTLSVKFSD